MNDQDLKNAKDAVESILNVLDVGRVVYVDDYNTTEPTVEDTIGAALTLESIILKSLFPELGNSPPDDPDILSKKIRDIWGKLDSDLRTERGKTVLVSARRHDGDETNDLADIAVLEQIIPRESLVSLSPTEWEQQQGQLLQESQDIRTLFIFDRDLTKDGGDSESGIKIIASLLARNDTGELICGLLTHTVSPEMQLEQWESLSKTHSIPRDRFVVISKRHLSQSPMLFAQTLKFAALSPDFDELKRKTKNIIAAAATAAADRVDKVSIYDLDHIVFQVSANEGIWEPDMLFRLHAMFQQLESRKSAYDGGELETIAARLRAVSGIPTKCDLLPTPGSAWALQREELYESDEHINRNYLPVELGDIFERVNAKSTKKYILLAPPCDLMVRSNGQRQPDLKRFPLAEIVPETSEIDTSNRFKEEMPYFDDSQKKKWYVNLKVIHHVRSCILDLCVFNQDGISKMIVNGNVPSAIRPAWKAHYKELLKHYDAMMSKANKFRSHVKECDEKRFNQELGGLLLEDDLFKGNLVMDNDEHYIEFNCRRIGRLSRTRSMGMLLLYTGILGRPAYESDLCKKS